MARSDPPFDAADETTTQPVGRQRVPAEPDKKPSEGARQEPSAAGKALSNTNWFDSDFESELGPQPPAPNPPQPLDPPASEAAPDTPHDAAPAAEPTLAPAVERESNQTAPTVPLDRHIEQSAEPPTMTPLEPPPAAEPSTMERVAAEIAAALTAAQAINQEPTASEDVAQTLAAPSVRQQTLSPAARSPAPPRRTQSRIGSFIDRAGKVVGIVVGAWFCVVFVLIVLYRFVNPPFSTLMGAQWLSGTNVHQEWVPLESISPNLIHAVIVSEDGRFCDHWGIDFVEIAEALKRTPRGIPRGASTITMQVAKNLFLWPAKSYLRKIIEVPLTYAIELFWPKRRILEVYLNIAEWGPGIFGAEAASQAHFNHPASRLSSREAAQLAVVLPNPIVRDAGSPGPRTAHRASVIQRRTGREPEAIACILGAE